MDMIFQVERPILYVGGGYMNASEELRRFDDRVTGKIKAFASQSRIVHIDINPSKICMHCNIKLTLKVINNTLFKSGHLRSTNFFKWRNGTKPKHSLIHSKNHADHNNKKLIREEDTVLMSNELIKGAIIAIGVGQHQMFAAQVPMPIANFWRDGFIMNVQELAIIQAENLSIKIVMLNNQHLGMVVQPEDIFYKEHQAYTYLGDPTWSQLRGAIQKDVGDFEALLVRYRGSQPSALAYDPNSYVLERLNTYVTNVVSGFDVLITIYPINFPPKVESTKRSHSVFVVWHCYI
ncbi:LOW QUALITY PROTEIN: hypothetical protein Cgig2_030236 [Carnegiea gigantea]|uniref:Thiamine pyrophosphate enzyme TPP-binding domain-containing protein n=1 Tax=Carnegiea gigantea TaxID=171969 RepID=A0A9Q1KGP1_9CARY|nr:LOW QUALITY PROTEIN: hypothetical protein Cgig2_030236 [Carnegiea gigantea]